MEKLRSSVRPLVTYAVVGALIWIVAKATGLMDAATSKDILFFFLGVASTIIAFWFGNRSNKPADIKPPEPTKPTQ
jgi:hypothetical protein